MTIAFPAAPLLTVILALVGEFTLWKLFDHVHSLVVMTEVYLRIHEGERQSPLNF